MVIVAGQDIGADAWPLADGQDTASVAFGGHSRRDDGGGLEIGGGVERAEIGGGGRSDAPSRQRACEVLEAARGLVVMSCDVVPGSSGSPVFAMRQGRPRIVALVSAMGACSAMDVVSILKKKRQAVGSYRLEITWQRGPEYPRT